MKRWPAYGSLRRNRGQCQGPLRPHQIRFLEGDRSFGPDEIEVLVTAFEDALLELQLTDREDPVTLTVARRIIELAKQGERDADRLRDRALESFRPR